MAAGRKEGSKNLKKTTGPRGGNVQYENKHGVQFTEKEKKQLESLVNSANRKRKRMLNEWQNIENDKGVKNGDTLAKMGKESDFVLAPKTKSLNRFKTKKEYQKYVRNLKRVVDRDYVSKRVEQYKKNYVKGLKNTLMNKDTKKEVNELIKHIKNMPLKDYMKIVEGNEKLEINYIYLPQQVKAKVEQLRAGFKVPERAKKQSKKKK